MYTDAWLTLLRDSMMTPGIDTEIKYIAFGNGTTDPADSDTKLVNELFRKTLTKQEANGLFQIDSTIYLAPFEANFSIREVGFFGGSTASDTKDSGVLVARVLYTKDKTELESIHITRSDLMGRG